jgi:Mn-dependent DtxR family transcriptional regulator
MVLGATTVFALAFGFGPKHGVVTRWWRHRSRSARTQRENTLKSIYHVLEARNFKGEGVSLRELAERRRETVEEACEQANALEKHGLATLHEDGNVIFLTPNGFQLAAAIVRNHRLWELYLTNQAQIAADHVHEDAEKIEHVLGEEVVRELERKLGYATQDPHGRVIPNLDDIRRAAANAPRDTIVGYGNKP